MKGYLAWVAILAAAFGLLGVSAFQGSASGSKPAPRCNPHNCPTTTTTIPPTTTTMPTTTTTICPTASETLVGRQVRLIAAMLAPAAFVAVAAATCGPPPPPPCNGPTTITTGGTYTGCWASTNSTPAVTIATSQPVTITNSTISGGVPRVYSQAQGADITITHTHFNYMTPPTGAVATYAVNLQFFKRVDLEHNTVDGEAGFFFQGPVVSGASNPLTVRYNQFTNMSGDITGGGHWFDQAIQTNSVNAPGVDISWNEVDNTPNQSSVEDNISLYKSAGTSTSPINVHDNYVNGAYPKPATGGYSGGGIMLGDGGGNYQIAQDNIVIRTTNYGVAISGGTNEILRNNVGVSACTFSDGTPIPACNVGLYVWMYTPTPPPTNDQAYGNTLGWWNPTSQARNDRWLPDCTGMCSNTAYGTSGAQVTLSDESAQTTVWQNKLTANGVTIGA